MPTVFIALQCCQCSTMQVKQQKKSSNKWTCVVCNQKQSVRKVFAQAFMAKDVRQFVQNFNMSRQLAEQNLPQFDEQQKTLGIGDQVSCNGKQKRTDWTEYIDPDEDNSKADENNGDEFEPKIITELPKPVLKKPKLKSYPVAKGYAYADDDEEASTLGKSGRKYNRSHSSSRSAESSGNRDAMFTGARKEKVDVAAEKKHAGIPERMKPVQQISEWKGQSGSKWSCYLTAEEGEGSGNLVLGRGQGVNTSANESSDQIESRLMDQMVDEEIHPDFL